MIGNMWVGEIPAQALSIIVNDNDGLAVNLNSYDTLEVHLLDPRNNEIDVTGSQILIGQGNGRLGWQLPNDRSLFENPGEYVMYLELRNATLGTVNFAGEYTIQVREMGGKR